MLAFQSMELYMIVPNVDPIHYQLRTSQYSAPVWRGRSDRPSWEGSGRSRC